MHGGISPSEVSSTSNRAGRLGQIALAVMAGITLGRVIGGLWWWSALALPCLVMMIRMGLKRRYRGVWCWGLLGCVVVSAMWFQVRAGQSQPTPRLASYLTDKPTLVRLRGRVGSSPTIAPSADGVFARFDYRPPRTRFELAVDRLASGQKWHEAGGRLLLTCKWADIRLSEGDSIEVLGWMRRFAGPRNPAEPNYRQRLADQGIVGAVTVGNRENLELTSKAGPSVRPWLARVRERWTEAAFNSLALGLRDQPRKLTLANMVLLGRWDAQAGQLEQSFRRVGLAHLLSISGAHLGILLGLTWLVARGLVHRPPRVVMIVLAVMILYLLTVPIRVPIVRASIMAGVLCAGNLTGRRLSSFAALSGAALVLVLWRPGDLFEPGFELSFLAVGALIRFTGPMSNWLAPPPVVDQGPGAWTWPRQARRVLADYLAASVVAFLAVMALVAYHFQLVSPYAVALALVSMPVFTLVLAIGYLKVFVGLVLPSFSLLLSFPLGWAADLLMTLVRASDGLAFSSVALTHQPTLVWVGAMLGCGWALGTGWFNKRPLPLAAVGIILAGWTWAGQNPDRLERLLGQSAPAIRVRAFAVGDGSCFLIQSGGRTWMFDCGSQHYLDVGRQTIVPALERLGVDRIDTLVISHADMDHYVGCLAVIERLPVGRVLMPPQMLAEARRNPSGPASFLVRRLDQRGLSPQAVSRGWHETHERTMFRFLWPAKDFVAERTNNTSLVLSVRRAQARLLVNGDIMGQAMSALRGSQTQLSATVSDLPHHGGFVDESPAWLQAVNPQLVLQSAGYTWRTSDHWQPYLDRRKIQRLVTHEHGMITVEIDRDGRINTKTFGQTTK